MPRRPTGSIKKVATGWQIELSAAPGSKKRRCATFDSKAEAERWWKAGLEALRAGYAPPDPRRVTSRGRTAAAHSDDGTRQQAPTLSYVAWAWHHRYYHEGQKAGPERAADVAGHLRNYVIPWFGDCPVDEITAASVENLLLFLAGLSSGRRSSSRDVSAADRTVTIDEAAEESGRSRSTIKRRRREGRLPNAYRDPTTGRLRIPLSDLHADGLLDPDRLGEGLSQPYARDILWALRKTLTYARRHQLMAHDPVEGASVFPPVGRAHPAGDAARRNR